MDNFEIFVNGKLVHIFTHPCGYGMSVEGAFWGTYQTLDIAVRAAVAVLNAPKFGN